MGKEKLPYRTGTVRLTSPYGWRTLGGGDRPDWHSGIDLVGSDKTIVSVADGIVVRSRMVEDHSDRTWEWGNYVAVRGDDGMTIYYCHLSNRLVKEGDRVLAGEVLGTEGNTGYSFGSHCHFEVRNGAGEAVNAADYAGVPNAAWERRVEGETSDESPSDGAAVESPSPWAAEAVAWAAETGLLRGDGTGALALREVCTREQAAVMLYRFHQLLRGG